MTETPSPLPQADSSAADSSSCARSVPTNQGNRTFRWLAITVLRFRWLALVVTFLLSVFFGYQARENLRSDTTDENFLSTADVSLETLHEVRREFGHDIYFQLLITGDVFTPEYVDRLRELHATVQDLHVELTGEAARDNNAPPKVTPPPSNADDFEEFEDVEDDQDAWAGENAGSVVDQITSLINVRQPLPDDDGILVQGLFETMPAASEWAEFKTRALADRSLVGNVVDSDGTNSAILFRTHKMSENDEAAVLYRLREIATEHDESDFKIQVSGSPVVRVSFRDMMVRDISVTMSWITLVILVTCYWLFRHPIGIFAPALVIWAAEIWTLGAMAVADTPFTLVSTILPSFIGCVGLGDSVHIISVYRTARAEGQNNHDAIVYAMSTTGLPVLLTTVTTAFGLLSFRLASLSAIQEMGTCGAFGVTMAFINSVILLPVLLSFNSTSLLGYKPDPDSNNWLNRVLRAFEQTTAPVQGPTGVSFRRRNTTLVVGLAIFGFSTVGLSQLELRHNQLDYFAKDHPTRVAIEDFENSVGGTVNVLILVEANPGETLTKRETLLALEQLETHIRNYDDPTSDREMVKSTLSFMDPIRESWRAIQGGDDKHYRIPDTQRGLTDMVTLFEGASPDRLKRLVSIDMQRALLHVRVRRRDALGYEPLISHIEDGIEKYIGDRARVRFTGSAHLAVTVVSRLIEDLVNSFSAAAIVISLMMILLLRDLRMGLLAMAPNLLPVFCVMGCMGYMGIALNVNTLLLGSVAIGVVVDDTIHFLYQFKAHYDSTGDVDGAVRHSFAHSGRAMVATSLILTLGMLCTNAAELVSYHRFGNLLLLTIVLALVMDFTIAPALLRFAYRDRAAKQS